MRGFVVKLYPTREQFALLHEMQREMRLAHNYWVDRHTEWLDRCIERTVSDGAMEPPAPFPEDKRERRAWRFARLSAEIAASKHCGEAFKAAVERRVAANAEAADNPIIRKQIKLDLIRSPEWAPLQWPSLHPDAAGYGPVMTAVQEALGRELLCGVTFFKAQMVRFAAARVPRKSSVKHWRRPRWRREADSWNDHTMLQTRDGFPLVFGSFGPRGWHDCQLRLLRGLAIDGRAGRTHPEGKPVMGAQLTRTVRGWTCSVRYRTPGRKDPEPSRGVVALGYGGELLGHTFNDDGESEQWENPRGNSYTKQVSWLSERRDAARKDGRNNEADDLDFQLRRYQLRAARRTKDLIYSQIIQALAPYETIVLGTVARDDAQGEQTRLLRDGDHDDDGGWTSAACILRDKVLERFGDRVVQVDCPAMQRDDDDDTARKVLAKYWEIQQR